MKKTIIPALVFVLATMCIMASGCSCGGVKQTGTAYGLVHNYYVGQVTVERSGDKIVSAKFEETEGPSSWAKRSNIKDDKTEGVEFTTGGFAKSISIGSLTFHATDDESTKTPAYKQTEDGVTFEEWVKTEENAKFYVEQMAAGNYRILKADLSAADPDFSTDKNGLNKGERWLKSKNGYWSGNATVLGWKGNMDRLSDYLVRNGIGGYTGEETKGDNGWTVNGVETGATLVDFHDYMKLARRAFESAQ
ncbi:MAG: hypothetical protein HFK09_03555 [Clostridia bacterium]|nr:hypothetical protein [Clostridia bacterium]